ncbi:unnamed protein product [Fructobacillus tropaeoli]|uniref:Uncharacterized protein n=1 Tax=Fructobacillus tropaeoli TaxID=709323 RepID=A0ABM9N0A5_9LACO|nr:unnamed protein product [Fructobacillus tropaeoli]
MNNKNKENEDEDQQPRDTLYTRPWFVIIGIIAVLSMVGYVALLG